jgi:CheY-like chemotaxis protein
MPGGGNLILDTQNVSLDEPYVTPFQAEPGRYVKLTVTDTGIGMSRETRERIFEPFFTTKGTEGGTGLGLASVYGIVRNHGGFINVYSAEGRGSTFILYFPPVDKEIVRNAEATAPEMVPGTGTILLVDDEPLIRESISKALSLFGHKVLTAEDGQKAIDIYRANRGEIKVVILDMVMTGMNGAKVFGCLKEVDPAVKVILSSGYGLNDDLSKIMARGCKAFVQKPFDVKELSQTIREVLIGH